jgi:hypothetical protein
MSIFKDTLSTVVQNQLTARTNVISQYGDTGKKDAKNNAIFGTNAVFRSDSFLRYVAGKNSWVKMSSFTDVDLQIGDKTYTGSELAKKYVLEGGTLYRDANDNSTLRSGIAASNAIYGSNIDRGSKEENYRPFGYRPMPGITSIDINNKSAYGSLREATVKYYCWDKHQLEELELLYMRTGYTVLLEWGWSQYLDSSTPDDPKVVNYTEGGIDIFNPKSLFYATPTESSPDDVLYDLIKDKSDKAYSNYDAMIGYIKNFSWNLMPNGGYECTTVLISRGEVISSLKINSNGPGFTSAGISSGAPPLTLFEQVFLNYAAAVNQAEFTPTTDKITQFAQNSNITSTTVSDFKNDLKSRLSKTLLKDHNNDSWQKTMSDKLFPSSGNAAFGVIIQTDGFDGAGIEYIKMNYFIALLNIYFNIKDKNNKPITQILIPGNTPCLASADSVSIDPGTCIIRNPEATFITNQSAGYAPNTITSITITDKGTGIPPDRTVTTDTIEEFLVNGKLGSIGNIYVAIPKIIEVFRSVGRNGTDVDLVSFLKDLLSQISKALGGINDFQLHTSKNIVQIIDVKYLEQSAGDKKYEFDLVGLKSICRNVRITSRIFESQSTMIAIGAGSGKNLGDTYSSTQNFFNKGLSDRLLPTKVIYETNLSDLEKAKAVYNNLIVLQDYIALKCVGTTINANVGPQILYPSADEVTSTSSLLKTLQLQLRGGDVDFKAIIPFELEITLDGISGLVQGQIFKINKNILPEAYAKSKIGFIITGISHSLSNNDWITTIKTQCCLLDNEGIPRDTDYTPQLLKTIKLLNANRAKNISLWSALADYMVIIGLEIFNAGGNGKSPKEIASSVLDILSQAGVGTIAKINDTNGTGKVPNLATNSKKQFVDPDFKSYYNNYWAPAAIAKYPTKSIPTTFDNARVITDLNGNSVTVPILESGFNRFLSYPVFENLEDNETVVSLPYYSVDWQGKDCFIFRDPYSVNQVKTKKKRYLSSSNTDLDNHQIASIQSLNYVFGDNSLLSTSFFRKISDDKYVYNFPLLGTAVDKGKLFDIFYTYVALEGNIFFSGLDAQFRPSAADIGTGNTYSVNK